jgi:3-oxoacyl-[acyl-carrier protein] reductase
MNTVDRYLAFSNSGVGKWLTGSLGLPQPARLKRAKPGEPDLTGPVVIGAGAGGRLADPLAQILAPAGIGTLYHSAFTGWAEIAGTYNLTAAPFSQEAGKGIRALVFDATGISEPSQLSALYAFFHDTIRSLGACGRVLVLGSLPEAGSEVHASIVQRGLEGFIRSLGKELRRGSTAQLVFVEPGAEDAIGSTVRFFLSPRSAYVSGQAIRLHKPSAVRVPSGNGVMPHAGRIVLITGASRGIGAAIAKVFVRDGAHVVALDVPAMQRELSAFAKRIGADHIALDITSPDAAAQLVVHAASRGGYDVIVHNAGITRDKTIAKMDAGRWDSVIAVNLEAPLRLTEALLAANAIKSNGRIVCLSSVNGIAGSAGQTNYALTKAGIIGLVQRLAPILPNEIAISAVAPGFIETQMTAAIPFAIREVARRLNSLSQGGLPVDVAETVSWLAHPGSGGLNGQVVRTCGQSLVGA